MKPITLRKSLLSLLLVGGILLCTLTPIAPPQAATPATTPVRRDPTDTTWLYEWNRYYGMDVDDEIEPTEEDYATEQFTPFHVYPAPPLMPNVQGQDAMRELLTQRLNTRDYPEEVDLLFYDTLDALYQNYATWLPLYREMPDVDTYVYEHLIAPISLVHRAVFYDAERGEGKKMLDDGEAFGWTLWDDDNNPEFHLILPLREERDELAQSHAIEVFYHELTHCHDNYFFENYDYYAQCSTDLANFVYSLVEGSTTFHHKLTYPCRIDLCAAWLITSEEESREINYRKETGTGYMINLNDFEKLVYFAGYRQMELLTTGQQPFDRVVESIEALCGQTAARELIKVMAPRIVYYEREDGCSLPETYNLSLEIEQAFFRCIQERVARVETWDQLMLEARLWDRYKEVNLPYVEDPSIEMWTLLDYDEDVIYHARNYENNGVDYDDYVGEYDPTYRHNIEDGESDNYAICHHLQQLILAHELFNTKQVDTALDQKLHQLLEQA